MTDARARDIVMTPDGLGKKVKAEALDRLLYRAYEKGYTDAGLWHRLTRWLGL
jgi:hypothetical protein